MNSPKRIIPRANKSPTLIPRAKSPTRSLSPKRNGGKTIVDIAVSDPNFSILVSLLKKADLVPALQQAGSFTVFAPTNKAFKKLDNKVFQHLLSQEGADDLKDILLYHVAKNKITSDMIKGPATPPTLQGKNLCVHLKNGKVKINDGQVIDADILANNGVIHSIDTVLTPLNDCSRLGNRNRPRLAE
jgi:uncharacterized surface protein with fasciclin (FAS1) repeats